MFNVPKSREKHNDRDNKEGGKTYFKLNTIKHFTYYNTLDIKRMTASIIPNNLVNYHKTLMFLCRVYFNNKYTYKAAYIYLDK